MPRKRNKPKPVKAIDKEQSKRINTLERKFRPEIKFYSLGFQTNSIPVQATNASVLRYSCTGGLAQGTSGATRIGDRIRVMTLKVTGYVISDDGGSIMPLRIMIVHDRRYSGTALTGAELLRDYNTTDTSYANFMSQTNDDYVNRQHQRGKQVDVLYDKVFTLGPLVNDQTNGVGFIANPYIRFSVSKDYKNGKVVTWSGATQGVGQIDVYVFPGRSTTSTSNPFYAINSEISYIDN